MPCGEDSSWVVHTVSQLALARSLTTNDAETLSDEYDTQRVYKHTCSVVYGFSLSRLYCCANLCASLLSDMMPWYSRSASPKVDLNCSWASISPWKQEGERYNARTAMRASKKLGIPRLPTGTKCNSKLHILWKIGPFVEAGSPHKSTIHSFNPRWFALSLSRWFVLDCAEFIRLH